MNLTKSLPDYFEVKIGSSIFELQTETLVTSMSHQYISKNTSYENIDSYDMIFSITKNEIENYLSEKYKNDDVFIDLFGDWTEDFRNFHSKKNEPLCRDLIFSFKDGSKWSIKFLDLLSIRTEYASEAIINFDDPIVKDDLLFHEWVKSLKWSEISHLADEIQRPQPEPDYEEEWANCEKELVVWENEINILDFIDFDDRISEEEDSVDRSI